MNTKIESLKKISIYKVALILGLIIIPNNKVRCPHPNHKKGDRNPSMVVFPQSNSWYCYKCGKGGTVIDLLCHLKNLSVKESIHLLEEISNG